MYRLHEQQRTPAARAGMLVLLVTATVFSAIPALGSSHREAPGILSSPQVDGTDFYMFRSYEPGREGYVTLIANYNPLQDPYGGPNYFPLDPDALYDIHISNDGDAEEDLTFRFEVGRVSRDLSLDIDGVEVPIPLVTAGPLGPGFGFGLSNEIRLFNLRVIPGDVDIPNRGDYATNLRNDGLLFSVPLDNIGTKTIPDYEGFAARSIHRAALPGCDGEARVFVGQRSEPFAVNLGQIFDLVNLDPLGAPDGAASSTAGKNITSLILEVPIDCLVGDGDGVIAGWTTARKPRIQRLTDDPTYDDPAEFAGPLMQVSRLGNPLVNEVVIGIPDKNRFNASHPSDDAQFLHYVTNPTLPALLEVLFGVEAPTAFPRQDLVQVFLTGIPGLTEDGSVGEMLRLNTAIDPTPKSAQSRLGVLGGDLAGFPNGRRPGDDVVDIALRAAMGVLLPAADAPAGQLPYTDGALQDASQFADAFPYLGTPTPGSP